MTTCICGRVAGTYELDSLKRDPLLILRPPVAVLLGNLSQECDHCLRAILICIREIDLITEYDKPLIGVVRTKYDA